MKKLTLALCLAAGTAGLMAQPVKVLTSSAAGTGTITLDKDTVYRLDGFVYVNPGQTLTIEPGTVIKADTGTGANASALIISRGARIIANGTKAAPITFTSVLDDLTDPFDLDEKGGLWGGVIVLGNSQLNTVPGEKAIEGIPAGDPRNNYGANPDGTFNDQDSSGVIRYVKILYSGTALGTGNEIQGLTLGGVGNKTVIEYVEITYCTDDGIEIFGGTVNIKYAIAAFVDDDSYDYDQGWRGKGQFWFTIQKQSVGADRCGEWDGADTPETGQPYAIPTIYNATFLGLGAGVGSNRMITLRANGGGKVYNSIFAQQGRGVDIEFKGTTTENSYKRFQDGDLDFKNNVFWEIGTATGVPAVFSISPIAGTFTGLDSAALVSAANTALDTYMAANNTLADPKFASISRAQNLFQLDPRPTGFPALSNLAAYTDPWFTPVTFKGAFALDSLWMKGWSHLDERGYLPRTISPLTSIERPQIAALNVYPNPSNGLVTVSASELSIEPVQITVLTPMGQQVYAATAQAAGGQLTETIDLSRLAAGVYLVKVQQGEKVSTRQIAKQ